MGRAARPSFPLIHFPPHAISAALETYVNMSTAIDAKGYTVGWLQALTGMMISDIKAIPDDKWSSSMGGCARPASGLLADTVTNMNWTTDIIKGADQSDAYNGMEALAEQFADKTAAVGALQKSVSDFTEAFMAAGDDRLNTLVKAPWGAMVPVYLLAQITVSHVWYHDGQFNFIHCLLGDDKMHWME